MISFLVNYTRVNLMSNIDKIVLDDKLEKIPGGNLKKEPVMKPPPWYKTIYNEFILKIFRSIFKK